MRVLIVEDEDAIAAPLSAGLRREGHEVTRVATGRAALEAEEADIALLDLRLPDLDGYEVCRDLRARSNVPIIIVTARGEELDRVVGLELGADDYVVKPFGFRELLARMRAVMRRAEKGGERRTHFSAGPLELDVLSRTAFVNGRELALTPKEFDLLAVLVGDQGVVVERRRILQEVWGTSWQGAGKTIDVHVASLRRKLGDPAWIETVRGVGLRLRPQ